MVEFHIVLCSWVVIKMKAYVKNCLSQKFQSKNGLCQYHPFQLMENPVKAPAASIVMCSRNQKCFLVPSVLASSVQAHSSSLWTLELSDAFPMPEAVLWHAEELDLCTRAVEDKVGALSEIPWRAWSCSGEFLYLHRSSKSAFELWPSRCSLVKGDWDYETRMNAWLMLAETGPPSLKASNCLGNYYNCNVNCISSCKITK